MTKAEALREAAERLDKHELNDPWGADFYVPPGLREAACLLREWADEGER
ncbi:hypothetical protein ACWDR0_10260 [Streptomyces sp. NPDC003691]